ncbi:pectinesterase family protein, partial [Ralstonia pseudosolanacearum]|uniref:pectinesterase family protein n=1 Tax=Ralstonia pseudosolanacearum TaxID=1310165 RepID=UPI003CF1C682
ITADPLYLPVSHQIKTYLGRPWKTFSRTIIMQSQIDEFVQPEGWTQWPAYNQTNHLTCYYAEYKNTGPGAGARNEEKRVKWPCIKNITDAEAQRFSPSIMFNGGDWIRQARVPYYSGMTPRK